MRESWCSTCKKYLPINEFRKNSARKSGVSSSCKLCEQKRDNSAYGKYRSYRRNARQRNIDFDLTIEEFTSIIETKCAYCGEYGMPYNGVDRIDNNKGYYFSNCAPCCEWCNKIKLSHTVEETIDHIKKMYKNLVD